MSYATKWNHSDQYGRSRGGKTAHDRANGYAKRRAEHRALRDEYTQKGVKNVPFPSKHCNGKKTQALRGN